MSLFIIVLSFLCLHERVLIVQLLLQQDGLLKLFLEGFDAVKALQAFLCFFAFALLFGAFASEQFTHTVGERHAAWSVQLQAVAERGFESFFQVGFLVAVDVHFFELDDRLSGRNCMVSSVATLT